MAGPYRERVQLLLIKIETTSGTDAAPSPTVDVVRTVGFPTVRMAFLENGLRDDVVTGQLITTARAVPAGRHMVVDASFEIAGSTTTGAYNSTTGKPEVDTVLRMMGMGRTVTTTSGSESIRYTTLDAGMETGTVWAYTAGGKLRKGVGGVVTSARLSATANGRGLLAVTIMAKESVDPAEAAFPTFAEATLTPPLFHSGAANIGAWTSATAGDPLVLRSAQIDFGLSASDRPSAGAADGLIGFLITDRKVRQTLVVEVPGQSTFDTYAMAKTSGDAGGLPTTAWQIGTAQYARMKVQTGVWALEAPELGADRGIATHTLVGNLVGGAPVTSREINLLFD